MKTMNDLRVLDLGWVWAGPLVGAAMAALGAEVVKVESATRLDPYRLRGVEREEHWGENKREASPSFHKLNRGKKSLALNLKHPDARGVLLALVEQADLLIENYSAGTLDRLGIGWEVLRGANPSLVALSLSAGGQRGRWKDLRAYALVTTAMAGYESLVRYPDEPALGGATFGIADPNISSYGVMAALAGLWRAQRTGQGAYIDLSGIESVVGVLGAALLEESASGPAEVVLQVGGDDEWVVCVLGAGQEDALAAAVGHVPLGESRGADRGALVESVRAWAKDRPRDAVVVALADAGVTVAPVLRVDREHGAGGGSLSRKKVVHPITGESSFLPSPWGEIGGGHPAPLFGGDTPAVLRDWLDMDDGEIRRLADAGILA
ncbi:CoA transferase [Pseudonocardia ailaonensis]|uniref:CoA transferase n=1 Tax=Pseudonocardia ailaonensis TaxID=367279 RepID=A0ABN2N421_9PSEU